MRTRTGGMAGLIGAVLLIVAGIATGQPPTADDSVSKVTKFLADKRSALRWQIVLLGVATILLVWFFSNLGAIVSRADAGINPIHGAIPLVGFALLTAIGIAGSLPMIAIAWRGSSNDAVVRMAWDVNLVSSCALAMAGTIVLFSAGVLVMRSRALPMWVAWFALVAAVLNLIGLFTLLVDPGSSAMAPGGFVAGLLPLLLAAVWIGATSVAMIQSDRG